MTSYKLQVLAGEDDEAAFLDLYVDAEKISSFYIAQGLEEIKGIDYEIMNLVIDGECYGIKQEPHIVKYLKDRFYIDCVMK